MQLSAEGLDLIKKSEGFRDHVYRDVAGFLTIGYGHLIKPNESFPGGISEPQAAAMLSDDVQAAEQAVARLVKVALTQGQFDALVDFCFNLGSARLEGSTQLRELKSGHHDAAARQLFAWDHAGGAVNAGLKARRQADFELWTRGAEGNGASAKPPAEVATSRPKTNAATSAV
ncbi:MAG: lysozyme [Terracidiphilus sp.]